jgi:hypothetical protein
VEQTKARSWRTWVAALALAGGGLIAGIAIAGTVTAVADPTAAPSSSYPGDRGGGAPRDESQPQRSDEQLLTDETADKVRAAALAKYPGATIQRVETDSDGVYEAHLITADGRRVTVEVGSDFAVTGEEAGRRR